MDKFEIIQSYFDENKRFTQFPGKRQKKKQSLILEYLALQFERGKKYSEKEINEILDQHHTFNDPATLRRLMFGSNLLDRTLDGRAYWLVG